MSEVQVTALRGDESLGAVRINRSVAGLASGPKSIDASVASAVWQSPSRTLTTAPGLTTEQSAQLAQAAGALQSAAYTAPNNSGIQTAASEATAANAKLTQQVLDMILGALQASQYTAPPTAQANADAVVEALDGDMDRLHDVLRLLQNRAVTYPSNYSDPAKAGKMIIYADDGTTVLYSAPVFEDAEETREYRGKGIESRGRLA